MNNRDYRFYIDRAKNRHGFKYDNQIQDALGFKGSMLAMVTRKGKHLSEEKMIELARLAGIDETIALMDLNLWKSEGDAKKAYAKILQKITASVALALGFILLSQPAYANSAMAVIPALFVNKAMCLYILWKIIYFFHYI